MKIFKKPTEYIISTSFFLFLLQMNVALATSKQTNAFIESTGLNSNVSENSMANIIAYLIKIFLSFLGIIFIVLVIWAGYNWMTAGGNEDKVAKAKTTLTRAIIGLVIIVSAYAITYFIFGSLDNATSGL